jgi:hypothetical protein
MKSNVCKIDNGTRDLEAILKESERVAAYNGLTHKQTLQLRLLCEEIDGMLPNIIDEFEGELWIDLDDGLCKVNVSLRFDKFTAEKKEGLVEIATNKKNAAAVGIVGKIRSALEDVFMGEDTLGGADTRAFVTEYYHGVDQFNGMNYANVDYAYLWSLDQYRNTVSKEEKAEEWDELEKSVIASVADDVIVGVKGKRADIVVIKKFV